MNSAEWEHQGWALWDVSARCVLQAIESLSEAPENMLPLPSTTLRGVGIGWGKYWPDGGHRKPFTSFRYPARLLKMVLLKHEGITRVVVKVQFTLRMWKIAGEIFSPSSTAVLGKRCRCVDVALSFNHSKLYKVLKLQNSYQTERN